MAVKREDFNTLMEQAASRVPYWARSTNPIVRRHLGLNWRTLPPELQPILWGVAFWGALFAVGLLIGFIRDMTLVLFLASILAIPSITLFYAHILVHIAVIAAETMQAEMRNNTFQLLRATPMSLEQIFLGKVAAALWQRMDDLVLVAQTVVIFSPPILFSIYTGVWHLNDQPFVSQTMVMISLGVSLLRLALEPVMFGMLAVVMGMVIPQRSMAITSTVALGAFYVLLLNLAAGLPGVSHDPTLTFILHFALPILLPISFTFGLLRFAVRFAMRD